MSNVTDLAQQKFCKDWYRAIICAWPAWEYIRGTDSFGKPFNFCRTWYAELSDEDFEELLAIAKADRERRVLEQIL